jgi:hypothetical protein
MPSRLRRHLSYANVMATSALFIALGGGAYAATSLPKGSVGTKQIRKNAVVSSRVKDRSLLARDFKAGQLPAGPQGKKGDTGLQGVKGDTGPAGSAFAFAHVNTNGSLDDANSLNVTALVKTKTGRYCLAVASAPRNAVAASDSNAGEGGVFTAVDLTPGAHITTGDCPQGTDVMVTTYNTAGALADHAFYVAFNK